MIELLTKLDEISQNVGVDISEYIENRKLNLTKLVNDLGENFENITK